MTRGIIRKRLTQLFLILSLATIVAISFVQASGHTEENNNDHHESNAVKEHQEKKFNAGKKIVEHITDAHEWHILDYTDPEGEKHHVSIPLPVILYDEGKLYAFWSSKLSHGHEYKGFRIAKEGKHKGDIIRVVDSRGEGEPEISVPLDLSITKNVASIIISCILLSIIFISVARAYSRRQKHAPKGLQSFLEPLILFIRDEIAKSSIGANYERFMPYLLTLFFFIFFNNLFGLVPFFPGGANVTGNLAVTGVMAFFTLVVTTFAGNKSYWQHIFNTPGVPWWLKFPLPLMPIIEIVSIFTKPFVLMIRLFANITAGHIIVLGFISLIFIFGNMDVALGYGVSIVSVLFYLFMSLIELLVAFIQAYVFTLLSALYFGMATEEHH